MSVKAILCEAHPILRDGLRLMLGQADVELVGETDSARDTVRLAGRLEPELVLLDIDFPDLCAVKATKEIVDAHPEIKVLILSVQTGARLVDEVLKAGASGYLGDDCDAAQLSAAIHAVMAGNTYLSPAVTKVVVGNYLHASTTPADGVCSALTAREVEILKLLAEGQSTKEIALTLHRSAKTVETHRQQLMAKLHLNSIAELTKCAIREGLTNLEQ